VKRAASKIFKSVTNMAAKCVTEDQRLDGNGDENDEETDLFCETRLLERVIDKLAALSAITMKTSPIDAETLEQLGEGDRAVLQGFSPEQMPGPIPTRSVRHRPSDVSSLSSEDDLSDHTEELVGEMEKHLEDAEISWRLLASWDFDALEIEEHQRHKACLCFMIFHLGLAYSPKRQQPIMVAFIDAAAQAYTSPTKAPYHNFCHAVDVAHCLFRLLNLCSAESYFSNFERFALIVSAVCHDVGHPGVNNPFLVETSHELAIRYNDNSPLENMHCAKLFEIANQEKTAVFADLDKAQYKEVRKVCIEAILHTDNMHHFTMVKEMQMLYEMNSEIFDTVIQMYQNTLLESPPSEVCELFADSDRKKMLRNAFLHFSDISNPTKPFHICKKWAFLIIDEFFQQGDREKELGITVQPLNDRDKVNKAYSQVGFIEFFVTPMAAAVVRLLPPLAGNIEQMVMNLHAWREEWVNTTSPPPDQEDLMKLRDRITKLEEKFMLRSTLWSEGQLAR
jgi:cAMP-specific phosphodiesterase 4